MGLTNEMLRQVMPHCPAAKRTEYLPFIEAAMLEFGIANYLRAAAFLAQLAHESGELKYMEELANGSAYENRHDLGNNVAGDGRRFKGRGPIQLTGRANYRKYGDLLGVDLINSPTIAATKEVGFRIAGLFWKTHNLNELADRRQFLKITKAINGGTNGQDDRAMYYDRALRVLPEDFNLSGARADESAPDDAHGLMVQPRAGDGSVTPEVGERASDEKLPAEKPDTVAVAGNVGTLVNNSSEPVQPVAGGAKNDPPVQVSQNGNVAKVVAGVGGISGLLTAGKAVIANDHFLIIVGVVLLAGFGLAIIFRGVLLDWLRMKLHADPNKINVK